MTESNNMKRFINLLRQRFEWMQTFLQNWPAAGRQWLLPSVGVCLAITSALQIHAHFALQDGQKQKDQATAELLRLQQAVTDAARRPNFLQKLVPPLDGVDVTSNIQKLATAQGLSLSGLSVREHTLSAKSLAHLEWEVSLKGTYPQVKSALAEILQHTPGLRIQSLKFKRSSVNDLQAHITLVLWRAPVAAAPTLAAR